MASCYTGATKTDRWYAFTPTTTGNYRIETCGSNFDTVLSLFDACGGVEPACNDNANVGGCTNQSIIEKFVVAGGQTVGIRVAGNSSTALGAGVLTVLMDCDADPDNDGDIDLTDLATLRSNFACNSGCTVDLNGDTITDIGDLAILLSSFGQPCQ